jgi:hypothetical protein
MMVFQAPQLMGFERKEGRLQSGEKRGTEDQNQDDDEENDQRSQRHFVMRRRWRDRSSSGEMLGLLIV